MLNHFENSTRDVLKRLHIFERFEQKTPQNSLLTSPITHDANDVNNQSIHL